jgi:uncharacterized protein
MTSPLFRDVAAVRAFIASDAGLRALYDEAEARLGDDPAHDVAHALRVASWTPRLAEAPIDPRSAVAAALLHDAVNVPKDSPDRARASELSADLARTLLPDAGFAPGAVVEVCDAIRTHSYSRGEAPRSPLGDALQDADRLEALGALGLFRCVATSVKLKSRFFHADDPWAKNRPLDDRAYALDHFFAKLLKLPATMRTTEGRREAARRARVLLDVARALGEELGVPAPPDLAEL